MGLSRSIGEEGSTLGGSGEEQVRRGLSEGRGERLGEEEGRESKPLSMTKGLERSFGRLRITRPGEEAEASVGAGGTIDCVVPTSDQITGREGER